MENGENIKKVIKEQSRFRILFVVVAVAAAAASIFILTTLQKPQAAPQPHMNAAYNESLYGLVPGTEVEISILTDKKKTFSYAPLTADKKGTARTTALPDMQGSSKYILTATLKKPDGSYVDINLSVNVEQQLGQVKAKLSGLSPDAKVTFMSDVVPQEEDIIVDWSGQIEISEEVKADEVTLEPAPFCLTIKEENTWSYCHIPYGGGAV